MKSYTKLTQLAAQPDAGKLFDMLAGLCEWDAGMGFHDSPIWNNARDLLDRIRDRRDIYTKVEEDHDRDCNSPSV